MDPDFWHTRWQTNQIAFHEAEANAMLVAHFPALGLVPGSRIFVPLCGKTRDIAWLLSRGHAVVAVELSELAIVQLFDDLGAKPQISGAGPLRHYHATDLDVFVGDFFDLTADMTGPVHATYDRAALVALPPDLRTRYAAHVAQITRRAPQLVLCFEYDQTRMTGPPFSIDRDELCRLYADRYSLAPLSTRALANGFRGGIAANEVAWLLR